MENVIKLTQNLSRNGNECINQLIITRDRKTNKVCIYNNTPNYKSELAFVLVN